MKPVVLLVGRHPGSVGALGDDLRDLPVVWRRRDPLAHLKDRAPGANRLAGFAHRVVNGPVRGD